MKTIFFAIMLIIATAPLAWAISKSDKCTEMTKLVEEKAKAVDAPSKLHNNRKYSQLSAAEIKETYDVSLSRCMAMTDAQVDLAYQHRNQMKLQK